MNHVSDIAAWQLVAAFVYPAALMVIVWRLGIPRQHDIWWGSLRMTVQLIATGYVLVWLFKRDEWWVTFLVLAFMEGFSIWTAFRRAKVKLTPQLKQLIAIALPIGTLVTLFYFLLVIVGHGAWKDPRYVVPLAGMVVGNGMTGLTLSVNRLVDGMHTERMSIEAALMLGASPQIAAKRVVQNAFDTAIMPTVISMLTIGVVALPGMMTGQILAGSSPLTAIKYQIAIILAILGSVAFSVLIFVVFSQRLFFNRDAQLVEE